MRRTLIHVRVSPSAWLRVGGCVLILIAAGGCWTSSGPQVVVYSALDDVFSEPILRDFEKETGVKVLCNFDVESTKTVGLVNRLLSERQHPRCDVFWNNEILHTLRLQREGVLDVYTSPAAEGFPLDSRSRSGHWHGLAARARVLIVNTDVLPDESDWPQSILDLADRKWRGKVAMAKPLFGTTASHAAVLFAHWGDERAEEFFRQVKDNVAIVSGNKQVAEDVAARRYAFGITDTDDAIIEVDGGQHVAIVFPDQEADGLGTLLIPNTLGIIKNGPNAEHARQLVDYLLRPEIEIRLAKGSSAQFPVNPSVSEVPRVQPKKSVRWMAADFESAADKWEVSQKFLSKTFSTSD